MKARITAAISALTPEILYNTWREIDYRLDIIRVTEGSHIEVYYYFASNLVSYSFSLCFGFLFTCILFSAVTLSNEVILNETPCIYVYVLYFSEIIL